MSQVARKAVRCAMVHSDLSIELVKNALRSNVTEKTPRKYGGDMIRAAETIDLLLRKVDALKNGTEGPEIPVTEIHFLKERLIDKAFKDRTPKKYATSMYEATEIISQLFGEISKLEEKAKAVRHDRICLNCDHMENMDYIHGCGVCAALEGETVILSEPCICPKDVLEEVESLLASAKKEQEETHA